MKRKEEEQSRIEDFLQFVDEKILFLKPLYFVHKMFQWTLVLVSLPSISTWEWF